jgi:hypothetical protein
MMRLRPFALLAVFLIAAGCSSPTSPPSGGGGKPAPDGGGQPPGGGADLKVNGDALAKEYADDKAKADARYKGKVIEVEGVAQAPTVQGDSATVTLGRYQEAPDKGFPNLVLATFPKPEVEKVAKLKDGQKVKVRGKCKGHLGNVILDDCTLLEAGDAKPDMGPKADLKVNADALAREYADDKAKADARYKGKVVEVEGALKRIVFHALGSPTVVAGEFEINPNQFKSIAVRAAFEPKSVEAVAGLTTGQKFTFVGKCNGAAGDTVDFLDCTFVKAGEDPAVKVSAAELTKAYAEDRQKADARFKDKQVAVEGVVVELKKDKLGVMSVILEGFDEKAAKPARVTAAYPADQKERFQAVKKGDRIKIKGECAGDDFAGGVLINYSRLVK